MRLVGNEPEAHWNSRGHFFAAAAELPETKIPLWERLSQLVEVTGAQRLQEHEPFLAYFTYQKWRHKRTFGEIARSTA